MIELFSGHIRCSNWILKLTWKWAFGDRYATHIIFKYLLRKCWHLNFQNVMCPDGKRICGIIDDDLRPSSMTVIYNGGCCTPITRCSLGSYFEDQVWLSKKASRILSLGLWQVAVPASRTHQNSSTSGWLSTNRKFLLKITAFRCFLMRVLKVWAPLLVRTRNSKCVTFSFSFNFLIFLAIE